MVRLFSGDELVSEAYENVASSGSGIKQTSQLSRSSSSSNSKEVAKFLFVSFLATIQLHCSCALSGIQGAIRIKDEGSQTDKVWGI